jgi:hypothetical protein
VSAVSSELTLKRVKVGYSPADTTLVGSSLPYQRSREPLYSPVITASWVFKEVKPGTTRQVVLKLRFPALPPNTVPTYGVALTGQVLGTAKRVYKYITLHYAT